MTTANTIVIKRLGGGSGAVSGRTGVRIPGVFPSIRFGEQVVSTGIPSLDNYIGGGIPLGSIMLIQDSFMSRYGDLILKCFLAEGATYNHHLYIASGKIPSKQFINELPSIKKENLNYGQDDIPNSSNSSQIRKEFENMKIAWRYQQDVSSSSSSSSSVGGIIKIPKKSKFEFKKKSSVKDLGSQPSCTISQILEEEEDEELKLTSTSTPIDLIKEISGTLKNKLLLSHPNHTNLMRISISHCEEQVICPKFMNKLRALVRHTNSCAIITVSILSCNLILLKRCEQLSDIVIHLQVFHDEMTKIKFGHIDGFCKIIKLSSINSLKLIKPPKDLGFIFKRKQLIFQELHLPPEDDTTIQREVSTSSSRIIPTMSSSSVESISSSSSSSSSSCGSVKGKSIDF